MALAESLAMGLYALAIKVLCDFSRRFRSLCATIFDSPGQCIGQQQCSRNAIVSAVRSTSANRLITPVTTRERFAFRSLP